MDIHHIFKSFMANSRTAEVGNVDHEVLDHLQCEHADLAILTVVRARIEEHTKEEATAGLAVMGLTVSDAFSCHPAYRRRLLFQSGIAEYPFRFSGTHLNASLAPIATMGMRHSSMMNFN